MKIALFTDIHGNKEALTAIINDIKNNNINEIICLGDTIGIGPNPKECLDIIINNNVKTVIGNHELYILKGTDIDNRLDDNQIKHQKWIKEQITDKQKEFLNKCNYYIENECNGKKLLFEHFLIENNNPNQYPFYSLDIIKNNSIEDITNKLDYDLIFIGHEHNNFILNNKLYDIGSSGCTIDDNTRYTILDTDNFNIETKIIKYDRSSFIKSMKEVNYPDKENISKWFFNL